MRADQEANEDRDEVTGAPMGAFTYLLVQALRDAGPKTTYQELMDRIGVQIVGRASNQNPQLEGDAQKVLFSGEWKAASKYLRVRPVDREGLLPIEAGSLHGMQIGSEISVFGHGKAEGLPLAKVKIVKVELGMSWGEPAQGEPKLDEAALKHGGQGLETFAQHVPTHTRILLGKANDKIEKMLGSLKFVAQVDRKVVENASSQVKGTLWDLQLVEDAGRTRIEKSDGTVVPIPRGKNQQMDQSIAQDDAKFEDRIAQAIEAFHRRNKLATLENNDAGSRMDVLLGVQRVEAILEVGPDGKKHPKVTKILGQVRKDGNDQVHTGEILQLSVENRSVQKAFFTILEMSTDGSVSVLYPFPGTAGGDNQLAAGAKRLIEIPFRMTPPGGTQIFKVIATEDDIDFRALEFQVKRGEKSPNPSPLQRIMGEVMDGKRSEPFGYSPEKLWGTDAARIELVEDKK